MFDLTATAKRRKASLKRLWTGFDDTEHRTTGIKGARYNSIRALRILFSLEQLLFVTLKSFEKSFRLRPGTYETSDLKSQRSSCVAKLISVTCSFKVGRQSEIKRLAWKVFGFFFSTPSAVL